MENKKGNLSFNRGKVLALVCLVVFALAFIFSCMKSVLPLGAGIVGTFGWVIYPLLVLAVLYCLAKFLGLSYKRSKKATVLMVTFIFCLLFIIHSIRTFSALDAVATSKTLADYLLLSYKKVTALGLIGSIFAGILSLLFGAFGTIIVFVIIATLAIGLFIDFELYGRFEEKHIKKIKSRKIRQKVAVSTDDANGNKPNYSFSKKGEEYDDGDTFAETETEIADAENYGKVNEYETMHETIANPNDYEEVPHRSALEEINFFGNSSYMEDNTAYNQNYSQNYQNYANPFGDDAPSGTPAFSSDVYEETDYPNVFTNSIDETRRQFMEATFGGINSTPSTDQFGTYETYSQNSSYSGSSSLDSYSNYSEPQNSTNQSGFSSLNETPTYSQNQEKPVTPEYVNTTSSFEPKPYVTPEADYSSNFESNTFKNEANVSSKPLNFDEDSTVSFPGMIGSSINDEVSLTSSSNNVEIDDFDDKTDEIAENNAVYGLDFDNKISELLSTSDDEEEEETGTLESIFGNISNKNDDEELAQKPEIKDFSFLTKREDDHPNFEEEIKNDYSKFESDSYSEPEKQEELVITSTNPIEPPKVTVAPKAPEFKKVAGYNLGMTGIRYNPPPLSLLKPSKVDDGDYSEEQQRKSAGLEEALKAFNIPAKVVNIIRGPKITRYELSVPLGVPVKKIPMYELDIKRALAAKTINIQAPIPGSSYVGIELENDTFTTVSERELLESEAYQNCKDPLPIAVGKDISGEIVVKSLTKMVHLLIAGSTGSGKSVFIHSIVMSLIYKHSPEDLRLIMIDPKKVEFNRYNGLPHLLTPEIVMGADKAVNALKWCVKEMERRYDLLSKSGYNNIEPYNKSELVKAGQFEKFPYIVIIVDEIAEIMLFNKKEVEAYIQRITQLARACGMHMILATQRPSVDIISGVIKNNVPSRIAFSLTTGIDSKTILNAVGAEKLLGQGDMLFSPNGTASMPRLQAAYCSDEEIKSVIDFDIQNNTANYDDTVNNTINAEPVPEADAATTQVSDVPPPRELDAYFKVAVKYVMQNGSASTSYLQRRLSIGYSRAAKIMDQMEDRGYIAPATGQKVRKIMITPDQFREDFGEDFSDISEI